jgi:hypothetical protein
MMSLYCFPKVPLLSFRNQHPTSIYCNMLQIRSILAYLALSKLQTPALSAQIPLLPQSHTEGYEFDALLHLPGISPYFDAVGSGLDHGAPRYGEVTAASYLIRHAQFTPMTTTT